MATVAGSRDLREVDRALGLIASESARGNEAARALSMLAVNNPAAFLMVRDFIFELLEQRDQVQRDALLFLAQREGLVPIAGRSKQ